MSLLTAQKSVRKWCDRLFMFGEYALDRWTLPTGRKILFSPWPEVETQLQRTFRPTRHEIHFGEIPTGGGKYDLVVPLSPETLIRAGADEALRRRNPLPIPCATAVKLLDDKAAFNEHLRVNGFGRHVPEAEVAGMNRYPYMLKRRWDSCARNAFRITGADDEDIHREKIESSEYLRQAWIEGDTEFTAHLLQINGQVRRGLTVSFRMRHSGAIRGQESAKLHRRCGSRHIGLFEAMLNSAGFEGLCCVNYKMRKGVPMILEINPRFGFSLAPFFPAFLRSLEWDRGDLDAKIQVVRAETGH